MVNIGIDLELDLLLLTRGRDFRWTFDNLDDSNPPQLVDFPAGDLFFELSTRGEHNGRGHIDIVGANGGSYWLKIGSSISPELPFDASQVVVKQAIESFTEVGAGNVQVTGYYTPQWIFTVDWTSSMSLSAGTVELFNSTVHAAFEAMDFMTGGLGVWLDGYYGTSSYTFTLTYKGSLLEEELINFVAGVISDIISAINGALTAVEQFTGEIADISLIYAPKRHFEYEFINDKALTPIPALDSVSTSLTGVSPTITVVQDAKGRAPFTIWPFVIAGSEASLKVESEDCDAIPDRTKWQLVFMPDGEAAGGDAVARGVVRVQAER